MTHGRPVKRRKLGLVPDEVSDTQVSTDLLYRATEWDLEQDYEKEPRSKGSREPTKLPIKTSDGRIELGNEDDRRYDSSDSPLGTGSESDEDEAETPMTEEPGDAPSIPLKHQILAAQEELAKIASLLNEDPQAHMNCFKKLASVGSSEAHPAIKKLVLAAQLAVYKDVIPGYRIRAYNDEDLGTKASKEVRQTRQYEQALVTGYHHYVQELASVIGKSSDADAAVSLKQVAMNCACTLLLAAPHFNFRTELLKVLVGQLSSRHPSSYFSKCVSTLEHLFTTDHDGAPSLEAVGLVTKMMKAKDYRVEEDVLNTFFHLRLLSEFSAKSSASKTDRPDKGLTYRGKTPKAPWQPRSKKERKVFRERKAVEKDMKEADAVVSVDDRDKKQSQTLQMVFATYFRILKVGVPHLTGAVLEGLAKFAHLINQDFFGDLLEVLKELVHQASALVREDETPGLETNQARAELLAPRNLTRESLLATQTAFTLLSGQEMKKSASALHLDLTFFTSQIYKMLYELSLDADVELGPKPSRPVDPNTAVQDVSSESVQRSVNVSTPILLLTRILTSMLLTPSAPPSVMTAVAFYKRLLAVSLQLPEKSTLALLALMSKVAQRHGRRIEGLWYSDERKGDGIFQGGSDSIESTNVLASGSGVWEMELLRHHFSPQVRKGVSESEKQILILHG